MNGGFTRQKLQVVNRIHVGHSYCMNYFYSNTAWDIISPSIHNSGQVASPRDKLYTNPKQITPHHVTHYVTLHHHASNQSAV